MSVTVTESGPLFDGRLERAVALGVDEAEERIADVGVGEVRQALAQVLQNPTGYYQGRVHSERAVGDWIVTDGGVVYGPWLAGVSARNRSTRFKGYAHWRRATQRLQGQAADIAGHIIAERIGAL
jgi:hypothetical protein